MVAVKVEHDHQFIPMPMYRCCLQALKGMQRQSDTPLALEQASELKHFEPSS
jgi:hypothetical protein